MFPENSEFFGGSANKLICFLFLPSLPFPQALVLDFLWCFGLAISIFVTLKTSI